jgi:cytochrome c peroxidase
MRFLSHDDSVIQQWPTIMKTTISLIIGLMAGIQILALAQSASTNTPGVVDLTKLANYANQTKPIYITRTNTPVANPITDAGATLGRVMFYDKRLSRNNTVSCSSCHQQANAFGDTAIASTGVNGTTGRHSMRLVNAGFATESRFFWDERAATLEAQTTQPVRDHTEMGFSGTSGDPAFSDLVTRLTAIPEYRVLFAMTYGSATITETRIQNALAQFVRSIQSFDSKYDVGRAQVQDNQNFPNFTPQENAGKALFLNPPGPGGGAGCAGCHASPEFAIDPNSRNNGITASLGGGTDLTNTRSPSLRDMVGPNGKSNGPLMHHGGLASIADVINHYNLIPADNTNLDPRLRRPGGALQNLNLTQTQKDQLAAFLRTLTGNNVYTDAKWASPFNANNQLTLIILPPNATTVIKNPNNTLTLQSLVAPGLTYRMESSTNLKDWTLVEQVAAGSSGMIEKTVSISQNSRYYRFTYTP